ncbi:hypothetical protein OEG84_25165 [Hoeflea sp. G2-23]|uniref:Uncharacterized protein n=1 Tax=Hoeflea algicola TaxID=2983763 RepID=A0ABT3ZGG5_9HYPH|nr:hypothetical protein [Hoeflea algicola]MCY0150899.1 hypothetical protein [Hoeflea algicola]
MENSRIEALETRIEKLEQLLASFAGMIVGAPGELQRVADTIEIRSRADADPVEIDHDRRVRAVHKIASLLTGNGAVDHSVIVRATQSIVSTAQLHSIIADLAGKGELKIIKSKPARGKPTTSYERIR